jgi:hypothetical protein
VLIWKEIPLRELGRLLLFIHFVVSCALAAALFSNLSSVVCHSRHRDVFLYIFFYNLSLAVYRYKNLKHKILNCKASIYLKLKISKFEFDSKIHDGELVRLH